MARIGWFRVQRGFHLTLPTQSIVTCVGAARGFYTGRRRSATLHAGLAKARLCHGKYRAAGGDSRETQLRGAFFTALAFPSASKASRTCLNSCKDALSDRGNRRFSVSNVLTIAEPITTRANHL